MIRDYNAPHTHRKYLCRMLSHLVFPRHHCARLSSERRTPVCRHGKHTPHPHLRISLPPHPAWISAHLLLGARVREDTDLLEVSERPLSSLLHRQVVIELPNPLY
jgi:hypothetical protein